MTGFAKMGRIHASDFVIFMRYNFICKISYYAEMCCNYSAMKAKPGYKISEL